MHSPHQMRPRDLKVDINRARKHRVTYLLGGERLHTCPASFDQVFAKCCRVDGLVKGEQLV